MNIGDYFEAEHHRRQLIVTEDARRAIEYLKSSDVEVAAPPERPEIYIELDPSYGREFYVCVVGGFTYTGLDKEQAREKARNVRTELTDQLASREYF